MTASDLAGRAPLQVDQPRIERAVREILAAVGEDPDREGLLETPARVARMYAELFSGLGQDPRVHLRTAFHEKYDEIVLVRDIAFNSVCEHHLLPFMGRAHIGYLPDGRVLGLSKLARAGRDDLAPAAGAGADDRGDRRRSWRKTWGPRGWPWWSRPPTPA